MSLFRSIGARPDATRGTVALETRKMLAGLLAPAGGIAGRPGVLLGAPAALVTGSASTSPWQYNVDKALFGVSRGESDGAHIFGNDGATTVPTIAAPGTSGASRIDIIYVLHPSNTENGDTSSAPSFGCANGNPTTGVPVPPSIPAGALELARNTMTNTATSTLSTGNTITQTWPYTGLRGAPIPVRSQAERDALTSLASAACPITVDRLDLGTIERNAGTGWVQIAGPAQVSTFGAYGIDYNQGNYAAVAAGGATTPLKLWRSNDNRTHLAGTIVNGAVIGSWAANAQYTIGRLHPSASAWFPTKDIITTGTVVIPATSGGDLAAFIIRGAASGSAYGGAVGDVVWQPLSSRSGITTTPPGLVFNIIEASW